MNYNSPYEETCTTDSKRWDRCLNLILFLSLADKNFSNKHLRNKALWIRQRRNKYDVKSLECRGIIHLEACRRFLSKYRACFIEFKKIPPRDTLRVQTVIRGDFGFGYTRQMAVAVLAGNFYIIELVKFRY